MTHPFHVSVCEIDHNPDTKSLQITHRIFIDDLEQGINTSNNSEYDLYDPQNPQLRDQLVKDYLLENFTILVDGKKKKMNFLGLEVDTEAIWCYVEIEGVRKLKELEVHNSLLMEIFPDQANIIHVTFEGEVKSVQLIGDKTSETVSFE